MLGPQINSSVKQGLVRERMTIEACEPRQMGIVVSPQEMVFFEQFTRDAAQNRRFRAATKHTDRPLAAEPVAQFGFSPRRASRVVRGPHDWLLVPSASISPVEPIQLHQISISQVVKASRIGEQFNPGYAFPDERLEPFRIAGPEESIDRD